MTAPVLFIEKPTTDGHFIGVISLNAEKTLNALTLEMVQIIIEKIDQWSSDDQLCALFLQGAGEKAFCAGGDVLAMRNSSLEANGGPAIYSEAFFEYEYRLDYKLHNFLETFGKPVVCWGHGIVMGGGLGLLVGCSHRVVTEKTRIAMPEITIALYPDVGASWFLNRMPGRAGLFLGLTGASINAADCLYTGLADHYILHQYKHDVLEGLASLDWSDRKNVDALLQQYIEKSDSTLPQANVEPNQATIDKLCLSNDPVDIINTIMSFETEAKWLARARDTLTHGSPLSALLIYHQLQVARTMTLEEVFQSELLLSCMIMRNSEFAEGVRALLVDKDNKPDWQYEAVEEVPQSVIGKHFVSPWQENPLNDL